MERVWSTKERTAHALRRPLCSDQLQRAIALIGHFAAGLLSGYIAWSFSVGFIVFALVPVLTWRFTNSRLGATLVFFGYYAASLSGQLIGGVEFFGHMSYPLLRTATMWLTSTAVLSLIWCVLWTKKPSTTRLIVALALSSLPPVGFVMGWASPLASAGVLFPGTSIFGPVALVIAIHVLSTGSDPHLTSRSFAAVILMAGLLNIIYSVPAASSVKGVDTAFGDGSTSLGHVAVLRQINRWKPPAEDPAGTIYLFPELVTDDWAVDQQYLEDLARHLSEHDQTALLGGRHFDSESTYLNALMVIGKNANQSSVLSAVIPAPIAHWRPWSVETAERGKWGQELRIAGKNMRALICYEQTLYWYAFFVFAAGPDVVLAPANIWWATASNIPVAQKNTVESVARLFRIPVVFAFNQ